VLSISGSERFVSSISTVSSDKTISSWSSSGGVGFSHDIMIRIEIDSKMSSNFSFFSPWFFS